MQGWQWANSLSGEMQALTNGKGVMHNCHCGEVQRQVGSVGTPKDGRLVMKSAGYLNLDRKA